MSYMRNVFTYLLSLKQVHGSENSNTSENTTEIWNKRSKELKSQTSHFLNCEMKNKGFIAFIAFEELFS